MNFFVKLFLICNLLMMLVSKVALSQHTGSIVGRVVDKDSDAPLAGANVVVFGRADLQGVETSSSGYFSISGVPVGRHSLQVSFVGYNTAVLMNVEVISARELQLTVALEPMVYVHDDVIIRAGIRKDKPQNDMALISARTFSVEETERFAGSFGDPARMATTFAGVMQGGDQLNEIIIRGNSPAGLLYMLDGFSIPNPTHFSSAGTSGGAISMLNSNTLSNSDFYTGAFPAEFGNALSGVFDLKLRRGSSSRREYLFQAGFNGFEAGLDGPFTSKGNATYLLNYRYSTLEVFDWIGLSLPVSAIPYFQDLTIHTNFPLGKYGNTSIFFVGGKNHIIFERVRSDSIYNTSLFGSQTAIAGLNHTLFVKSKMKITAGIAFSHRGDFTTDTSVTQSGRIASWYGQDSWEQRLQTHLLLRYKHSNKSAISAGIRNSLGRVSLFDSVYFLPTNSFIYTNNLKEDFNHFQAHIQHRYRFSDKFSVVYGAHFHNLSISKSSSIEPRLAINYDVNASQSISAGFGLHSQTQPRHIYFVETLIDTLEGTYLKTNRNLGFSKSSHFVLGHQYIFSREGRVKTEVYYQNLTNIPVEQRLSYFSMLNYGSFGLDEGSNTDSLVNKGVGYNYGVEFTIERFFTKHWYGLFAASLFDSRYQGSDLVWRNTLFNSNYIFNLVGGYEHKLSVNHKLSFDVKTVWAGGLRKLPINLDASIQNGRTVYDYSNAFTNTHGDYYRLDLKASLRLNYSLVSHVISFELMNTTNRKNHFIQTYNPSTQSVEESTQLGLTPVAMYRVVF